METNAREARRPGRPLGNDWGRDSTLGWGGIEYDRPSVQSPHLLRCAGHQCTGLADCPSAHPEPRDSHRGRDGDAAPGGDATTSAHRDATSGADGDATSSADGDTAASARRDATTSARRDATTSARRDTTTGDPAALYGSTDPGIWIGQWGA